MRIVRIGSQLAMICCAYIAILKVSPLLFGLMVAAQATYEVTDWLEFRDMQKQMKSEHARALKIITDVSEFDQKGNC